MRDSKGIVHIWVVEAKGRGDWEIFSTEPDEKSARESAAEAITRAINVYEVRIRDVGE